MTHTPGPWKVIYGGDYIVPESHSNRPVGGSVHEERDRDHYAQVIAETRRDKHGRGSRKANSRLISAAPDLLEAGDKVLEELGRGGYAEPPLAAALSALTKAVTKAKGE